MNQNVKINLKNNNMYIEINPLIYDLSTIYSACYVFIDQVYILIDGDPKKKIIIEMVPKSEKQDMKKIGAEFNNELLNYAHYKKMNEKNSEIKKIILQRALITNDPSLAQIYLEDSEKLNK